MSERCMVIGCEQPVAVLDLEEKEFYCEEHAELNDVRLGSYEELKNDE